MNTLLISGTQADSTPLSVGQIIFTDGPFDSNRRVICEVLNAGTYKTVSLDGLTFKTDQFIRPFTKKFGIGVYYKPEETMPLNEVEILVEAATIATEMQRLKSVAAAEKASIERAEKIKIGSTIIPSIPADMSAIIVAQLRENESDLQSDYFGYSTQKTIYLAFSKHKRDLFPELRKAAAKFESTKCYATAPTKPESANEYWSAPDEHREKYSMGDGYYLGESKYAGWIVSKERMPELEALQIAAAEGRFLCEAGQPAMAVAPIDVAPGKVKVIEYSDKAIAVIGDTKPIKDKLLALGGKFNFRLSCGAGWIFPKSKIEDLKTLFAA